MLNFIESLRGTGLKTKLLHPQDDFFDWLFGIKTFAYQKYSDNRNDPFWKGDYMPSSYKDIFSLLRGAKIGMESVMVDFGCGLGRVVFTAAYLGAKRSIGVEFNEELFRRAESNRITSRFLNKVSFVNQDASGFMIPDDANIFFFFNPFGSATMSDVIKRIEWSLETAPRKICVIYFNPMFSDALQLSNKLKLREEWPPAGKRYTAQFWVN